MKIVSVANQKGGASKTTTAAHIAWAAREQGFRVLVVDLDKQANMSYLFQDDEVPSDSLKASQLFFRGRETRPGEPDSPISLSSRTIFIVPPCTMPRLYQPADGVPQGNDHAAQLGELLKAQIIFFSNWRSL